LYFTVDLEGSSYVFSEPFGVLGLPQSRVMTIRSYERPPLVFETDDFPASGEIGLYAESGATPCAALDVGPQGVDSNDSFAVVTATGGGNVVLARESRPIHAGASCIRRSCCSGRGNSILQLVWN
jgi:hypothetical protein